MESTSFVGKKRIVIVGGGFGGVYTAKTLLPFVRRGKVAVTLINKTNYFLFTPLLHEVATGGLSPRSIVEPLREIFSGEAIRMIEGIVVAIDTVAKEVILEDTRIPYDSLVLATGSETNFYNIPGAKEFGLPLRTLGDALRIRNRVIDTFQNIERKDKHEFSIVVVGGGATGVEVIAELQEYAEQIRKRYYPKIKVSYALISATPEILKNFSPNVRSFANKVLTKKSIRLYTDTKVFSVSETAVSCGDKGIIPAEIVIWTAGVRPLYPKFLGNIPMFEYDRIVTNAYFQSVNVPDVFALGDVAAFKNEGETVPLPMLAQVVTNEGKVLGRILMAQPHDVSRGFSFRLKGMLLSLGRWRAVGDIPPFFIHGPFAWWLWRTVYLFKFFSWKKRMHIMFEWTFHLFASRDVTRIEAL